MNAICSWSGGKDSCFALMKAINHGYVPKVLLNVLNEEGKISRSHGIPANILQAQADAAGLPVHLISSSWNNYEVNFVQALKLLKKDHQVAHVVFGDIDLQEHRDWEEKVCDKAELRAVLPLWKEDRKAIVCQMLNNGMEAIIVSCNQVMGKAYLGKMITEKLLIELDNLGIDPCGENGEYHTLVIDCPLFAKPVSVQADDFLLHENYWFTGLSLVT